MGLVFFVFTTIRRCIDILCFMLDLNFWLVNSVVRLLVWLIAFVNNLPVLLTNVVVDCWSLTQFCVRTAAEVISTAAHDTISLLGGWLRLLGGVTEGIKMLGHLFVHVQLRAKELLNRGLLSGHCVLRQLWEGCGIVLSLVLYFINTIINMLLLGVHKCYFVAVGLWEVVSGPLENTLELAVTLVTFLYSSLVGTSILLWTPCQLALEFLGSLGHIFVGVFLLNPYGLVFTSAIVAVVTLYFNPSLARRGAHHTLRYIDTIPTLHRLQRVLHSVYLLALERAQTLLEMYVWQRAAWQGSRLGRGRRDTAVAYGGRLVGNDRDTRHPAGNVEPGRPAGDGVLAVTAPQQLQDTELEADALNLAPPCSSTDRPLQKSSLAEGHQSPPADSLLSLLKEQEERKKCVICQDSAKTVVLLPCRHLCLCRDCTDILLRQPIYQHNCPLCRHMILQTMDVYI